MTKAPEFSNDIQAYEALMDLVFSYSSAAHDFGFAHKMNNRFTALSMNASFLKQALAKGDVVKATVKAEKVIESINNLVTYSQELMNTDQVPVQINEVELNSWLDALLISFLRLPPFKELKIDWQPSEDVVETNVDTGIITVFLFAFLKQVRRFESDKPILITAGIDPDSGQYLITTRAQEIRRLEGDPGEVGILFPSPGEMPLRYLARVIRNVSRTMELIHREDRPLDLELRITITG